MMFLKHKIAILLTATLFLSGCDSLYRFAGSDSIVNPVNWVSMLYENDEGISKSKSSSGNKSSSDNTSNLFEKPSPNPVSCMNSSICGQVGKCVKKPRSNRGICMVALDSDGKWWVLRNPLVNLHQETIKVRSSYGSCSSDFNCPSTFECDQTYKVCTKK